ncbi:MAG: hypothetical protein ACRYF2_18840 [Janthinobacterium lividum]
MKLHKKLEAVCEDFENGRLPLVPTCEKPDVIEVYAQFSNDPPRIGDDPSRVLPMPVQAACVA